MPFILLRFIMTTIFIKLLLLSFFYVLVFGYECGISSNQEKPSSYIINRGILEGDWPWIVAVFHNGVKICTGSIISPRFVLTAAHCYTEQILNRTIRRHSFSIHAGTIYATEGEVVRVKKIQLHEDEAVSKRPRNDIAVFELERPLVFNHNVSSICLPKNFQEFPGNMAYLAGFGNVVYEDHDPDYAVNNARLNYVSIPFQDFEYCEKASQSWNYTSLNYICAGSRGKGSSYGDSGAPLMIKDKVVQQGKLKSRWLAVGVVAGGHYLESNTNDPLKWSHDLHTRVSYYCDWIKKVTDEEAQCIDVGKHQSTTKSTKNVTTECVCPAGNVPIFVNQDVPAAYTSECGLRPPTKTCATGQFECFSGSTIANPSPFCYGYHYAFSVLNSKCASFAACDSSGICYTPYNPGSMVGYRFAPYCNGGLCCINIFIENGGPGLNTGLISSTGTIYDHNKQYITGLYGSVSLNFTCSSSGPYVFNIDYVSCSGPLPPPRAATG